MKPILLITTTIALVTCLTACKGTDSKTSTSNETSTETSSIIEAQNETHTQLVDSSDLAGTPNGQLTPEVNGQTIDSYSAYDQLSVSDQNQLIYNYLVGALTALAGDEAGAKELLDEQGYQLESGSALLKKLREKQSDLDFNQALIKLVGQVIE
ncbi:hypothetical protein ACWN8B_03590 [Vagococcus zengguangii]|uniref:Uncharacterized protein n=1 Tax=Vagococcus zengguangii TaxID=2571750 RepID=A0A4D7CUK0_9ENTE|nr:hypothetical protein [Vagococcus zengguangii]QCI87033.1 hypothetical protein FA707_08670 [Vagococcus zengguangii]